MSAAMEAGSEARIGPLPSLPLFYRLEGRKAVVAGSSGAAEWKAELLAAAGAKVVRPLKGWTRCDLDGAAIAIGDFEEPAQAARFAAAARSAGALVGIIDRSELSDIQFGAIVNRAPVVIAISTDGAAPMLGQSIRARIESLLPVGLSAWARAAKQWRPRLKSGTRSPFERRRFWERFVAAAWREPGRLPSDLDFEDLARSTASVSGRVILVGAGPGDPELLTLKAVRALQSATVILHDRLVGSGVLELARRESRRIPVGKSATGPSCRQEDINSKLIELARAGETVVRLKGGDPLVFGRAAEEIAACRAAGVEVAIVPGISAAQGAAASLLMPLTERSRARKVQFVTGHGHRGRLPDDISWSAVADKRSTTVLYMPRKTLAEFVRRALSAGLDPDTPAVAIASATLPGQSQVGGTVVELPQLAGDLPETAPMIVIIGPVARLSAGRSAAVLQFARTGS